MSEVLSALSFSFGMSKIDTTHAIQGLLICRIRLMKGLFAMVPTNLIILHVFINIYQSGPHSYPTNSSSWKKNHIILFESQSLTKRRVVNQRLLFIKNDEKSENFKLKVGWRVGTVINSTNKNGDFFSYLKGRSKPFQIHPTYFLITSLSCSCELKEKIHISMRCWP